MPATAAIVGSPEQLQTDSSTYKPELLMEFLAPSISGSTCMEVAQPARGSWNPSGPFNCLAFHRKLKYKLYKYAMGTWKKYEAQTCQASMCLPLGFTACSAPQQGYRAS